MSEDINREKFFNLPEVRFAEIDAEKVINSIITMYEGIMNTTLFPADPVRLFLSTLGAMIAQQNIISDFMNKQNLLRYATGNFLDHIAVDRNVYRLEPKKATVYIRFTLNNALNSHTTIPSGTRVTNGNIFFATNTEVQIPAGNLYGDTLATCLSEGFIGNGFVAGQINKLVDVITNVTAKNITTSGGGSDLEDDDSFRNRIRLQPESFTTAGSELAYIFWALSAHPNISDVSVTSPLPCHVNLWVMLKNGEIPEPDATTGLPAPEIIAIMELFGINSDTSPQNTIANSLTGKRIRPLTDYIQVLPVKAVEIDYNIRWFITSSQGHEYTQIKERIENAITEYETWQKAIAGRDINPDMLIKLCIGAGAKRVVVMAKIDNELNYTPFRFIKLERNQVAKFINNNKLLDGIIEDE